MKRFYYVALALALTSCSKKGIISPTDKTPDPDHPAMQYINLNDAEVRYGKFQTVDLDGDGVKDFIFSATLIGDAINKVDKLRFNAVSGLEKMLFVDDNNGSQVLNRGKTIPVDNKTPYSWWELSEVFLIEKITGMINPPYWQGPWSNMTRKYFPLQVKKNGLRYNGWIELSFDTDAEELILHKAAISKEAEKAVKAGL